ncbi:MAG TPA: pirin-like C-terminal cupin domain-containing protein, partial [Myxococcota bacterium]
GHTAIEVIDAHDLRGNDPFVLLMDDRIDLGDVRKEMGGAHPHAGLETVTLVLDGTLDDRDEGTLHPGDALWMTAGRGIIHSEEIVMTGKVRVLQLWIRLPATNRFAPPGFELVAAATQPVHKADGVVVRLYSGTSNGLTSTTTNYAPVTMADIRLQADKHVEQELPATYNGFFYVVDGSVIVDGTELKKGQVGWLAIDSSTTMSTLSMTGGAGGGRAILYAGQPQNEALVHHGPFIAGNHDEIGMMFHQYRDGRFTKLSTLSPRK